MEGFLRYRIGELIFGGAYTWSSLRSTDAFPVVTSLPQKNSVCEPEQRNDFHDVEPF